MTSTPIRNALTIDVEDYFQVSAFAPHIARESWDHLPCRVERNVDLTLAMLDDHKARATYFTLGWIAERYPSLVRRIVEQGHELASHGYAHQRATHQSREEFRQDITRAKQLLEDIGGIAVKGYRPRVFPWARQPVGAGMSERSRLPLQLERISHTPRSLRHARRAALRFLSGRRQRTAGAAGDYGKPL